MALKGGIGLEFGIDLDRVVGLVGELKAGVNGAEVPSVLMLERWGFGQEEVKWWCDEWGDDHRLGFCGLMRIFDLISGTEAKRRCCL